MTFYECIICKTQYENPKDGEKCYKNCLYMKKLTIKIMSTKSWSFLKYKRLKKIIFKLFSYKRECQTGITIQNLGKLVEEYKKICPECLLYNCAKHKSSFNYPER